MSVMLYFWSMHRKLITVLILLNWALGSCKQQGNQMKEKIIRFNDIELYTESFGSEDDPAILLLAGATVSMLYWDEEFCQRLAERGFFVIRYDNRDVGKSTFYEPGTTPYDIVDMTNDAMEILDSYAIKEAHLVGMSLGGLISQIAAIKFPERINSLVLLSTVPWGDSDPTIPEMDRGILDFQSKSGTVDWTQEDGVVDYLIQGAELMNGRKQFDRARNEKLIRAEFNRANNYRSMFNHAALQGGEEYWNRLNRINQPTLIVHGTDDKIWHYKNANVLREKIKGSKVLTLEGTGHELHSGDWNLIIDSIEEHVRK